MKSIEKQEHGITLVALVITIMVLVILTAVAIGAAYETGIIELASSGARNYVKEGVRENEIFNGTVSTIEQALKTRNYDYFKKTGTINGHPGNSYNPTIPIGFRAIDENGASWGNGLENPTKESVNKGLVIEDKLGNQFVWVPCTLSGSDGTVKYERDSSYTGTWTEENGNTASISKYGGFYVARYEAGVPDGAPFYASENGQEFKVKDQTGYIPVSKANTQVWNCIKQLNAELIAESMYKENSDCSSALIDSYAWDTTVAWMSSTGIDISNSTSYGNYADNKNFVGNTLFAEHLLEKSSETSKYLASATKYQKGSVTLGGESVTSGDDFANYKDIGEYNPSYTYTKFKELATGAMSTTIKNNIYDMAGNVAEWTSERRFYRNDYYCMTRGGSFTQNGSEQSIKYRDESFTESKAQADIGFRVVIYLKVS